MGRPATADEVSVWHAQGIVMEVFGCELSEAAEIIRWRAVVDGRTPVETADGIVRAMR